MNARAPRGARHVFGIRPYENRDPVSRTGRLFERINTLAPSRRRSPLTLHALEQDARALLPADAAGGRSVLGAVAALRGEGERVRYHFRTALRHDDHPAVCYLNYSIALLQVGESEEAHSAGLAAFERVERRDALLAHLAMTAFESGYFSEARDLCARWSASRSGEPSLYEEAAALMAEAVESGMCSEEGAAERLRAAHRIRGAAGVRPATTALYEDGERYGGFRYEIVVHASPVHAGDLNERLALRLEARDDPREAFDDAFRVRFVAAPAA